MPEKQRKFKKAKNPKARTLNRYKKKQEVNPLRATPEYREFRILMLKDHPVCAKLDCYKDATDIHHIERITDNEDRIFDPTNILCVCHGCHYQIESAINRGIDPAIWSQLFEGLE